MRFHFWRIRKDGGLSGFPCPQESPYDLFKVGHAGTLDPEVHMPGFMAKAAWQGVLDIWQGLIMGARNMISVGVATATAGIIVGVVTITGLVAGLDGRRCLRRQVRGPAAEAADLPVEW